MNAKDERDGVVNLTEQTISEIVDRTMAEAMKTSNQLFTEELIRYAAVIEDVAKLPKSAPHASGLRLAAEVLRSMAARR